MKKIFILITILAIGILSCRNKQNESTEVGVSQNNTSNITEQSQKNNYNKAENTDDFPDESNENIQEECPKEKMSNLQQMETCMKKSF